MEKIIQYALGACLLLTACGNNPNQPQPVLSSVPRDTLTGVTTAEFQENITPEAVLEKFRVGNKRFLESRMLHRNYLSQVDLSAKGQHPYAVIVSCIDSRKPAEI